MKIPQLIVAAGIATASLVGLGGVADAAPTAGSAASVCVAADAQAQFNGDDASVSTLAACEAPACAEGVLATVTDDSGVQHQACVASAATDAGPVTPAAPAPVAPALVSGARSSLSQPVPSTGPAQLPRTGAGTGGLVIAAILVATGSIASLLSRRKPAGPKHRT